MDNKKIEEQLTDCVCRIKSIINILETNPLKIIHMEKIARGAMDKIVVIIGELRKENETLEQPLQNIEADQKPDDKLV